MAQKKADGDSCGVVKLSKQEQNLALPLTFYILSQVNKMHQKATLFVRREGRGVYPIAFALSLIALAGDQTQAAYFRATHFIREVIIVTLTLTTIDRFQ